MEFLGATKLDGVPLTQDTGHPDEEGSAGVEKFEYCRSR
jgi:hypothetical protein